MRPSNGGGNSGSFLGGIPPGHNNFPNQPLLERSMSQNPAPRPSQPSNTFKEKSSNFIYSLATVFAKRNQPLPPSLTGIPTPTYDPINSPFKDIEAGSEHGSFRLAGKDINIFHLWTMIWHRGGMGNVCNTCLLSTILSAEYFQFRPRLAKTIMLGRRSYKFLTFRSQPSPHLSRYIPRSFFPLKACIGRISWNNKRRLRP